MQAKNKYRDHAQIGLIWVSDLNLMFSVLDFQRFPGHAGLKMNAA